jgi:hypothetical protein
MSPIVKKKSRVSGSDIIVDKFGDIDLSKIEKHYRVSERMRAGEKDIIRDMNYVSQKLTDLNSAPLSVRTKTGRIVYFHFNVSKYSVVAYESLYAKLENLVKRGEIKYNPFVRMIFKEVNEGNYVGIAEDAGETLYSKLVSGNGISHDKIANEAIDIFNLFKQLGFIHDHFHTNNFCIDSKGRLRVIDISQLSFEEERYHLADQQISETLTNLVLYKYGVSSRTKRYNLDNKKKEELYSEYSKLIHRLNIELPDKLICIERFSSHLGLRRKEN